MEMQCNAAILGNMLKNDHGKNEYWILYAVIIIGNYHLSQSNNENIPVHGPDIIDALSLSDSRAHSEPTPSPSDRGVHIPSDCGETHLGNRHHYGEGRKEENCHLRAAFPCAASGGEGGKLLERGHRIVCQSAALVSFLGWAGPHKC